MGAADEINGLLRQAYGMHQQGDAGAQALYERVLGLEPTNQDALVLLGALHYETGAYAEAVSRFAALQQVAPERTDYFANYGAALQLAGRTEDAIAIYQRVAADEPSASAFYNLASALKDAGQTQQAIAAFEQALTLEPRHARVHNNLGLLYGQQGEDARARRHLEQAVALQPDYALAWLNLGDLLRRQGELLAAAAAYQKVLALHQDPGLHYKLGTLYQQLGDLDASQAHLESAVSLAPAFAEAWRSLGATQQAQGRFEASIESFGQAVRLRPDYSEALVNLGNSQRELGEMPAALAAYEQALAISPGDANRVRLATVLPPIYRSVADVAHWRERFSREVMALAARPLSIIDPLTEIGQTNFYLAYQGGDDRPLQEQIASLYRPLLPEAAEPASPERHDGKRRIGVLSAFLYHHTVTHYYQRHLELLAADPELELILLFAPGNQQDQTAATLAQMAAQSLQLPRDLKLARQMVADLRLDALVYLDIGLEPFSYFLSFTRLAPMQCVLPGHPVTTGIPTVDYYVSNSWIELPEADAHYSEKLVRLESLPVWYKKPKLPEQLKDRAGLGLSPDQRIYLCPMTLFKIHPDMDKQLASILEQDDKAVIYFFRFRQTLLHEKLQQRFATTIPQHERIHFLPWADPQTYFSWLSCADVLLDSFHFGGGSTHYLCFATGTPLITWPSAYLRGRSGAGMYRRIGIEDAIAADQDDFARLAVEIARDPGRAEALRKRILAGHDILFENDEGPRTFVEWIKAAVSA